MPDTIRTRAELNALFASTGSGTVSAQDIRDLIVSMGVYAEIGAIGKASINLVAGWQALDFDVSGVSVRGLNVDTTNKVIDQVPVPMEADLLLSVVFKGDAGQSYDFTVFKDPLGTPVEVTRMRVLDVAIVNASQVQAITWNTTINLAANDALQAVVRPQAANDSFELLNGVFRVSRKGVE